MYQFNKTREISRIMKMYGGEKIVELIKIAQLRNSSIRGGENCLHFVFVFQGV